MKNERRQTRGDRRDVPVWSLHKCSAQTKDVIGAGSKRITSLECPFTSYTFTDAPCLR